MTTDLIGRYLSRCAYEGIEFPALRVNTTWGHDSVAHEAYLRPGAELEPTGRKPLKIAVEAIFINTLRSWPKDLFPTVWKRLLDKIKDTPKGVFTHPTRGFLDVVVDVVDEPIDAKSPRNGMRLSLQLTEDNATASVQLENPNAAGQTQTSPATAMQTNAAAFDAAVQLIPQSAISGIGAAISTLEATAFGQSNSFVAVINSQLSYLESSQRGYMDALQAIAVMRTAVNAGIDAIALLGIPGHDARVALEALRVSIDAYEDRYVGLTRPASFLVTQTASLARIASLIYGDPSKVSLLRSANDIANPFFVPVGTELIVLPAA